MKYCSKCGVQVEDDVKTCPQCGNVLIQRVRAIKIVAKVFMIVSSAISAIFILPLAWVLPMTIHYCNAISNHQKVGIGFKICTLIFVNTVAGVLMLIDDD
jgi:uncharacterized membrane protein YvbJ